jgi:hypothetical protein
VPTTPLGLTSQPLISGHSPAAAVLATQAPAASRPSTRVTSSSVTRANPRPAASHPTTRPTAHPTTHTPAHPTTPTSPADGSGSQLPWWWYLVPHTTSLPHYPITTHTYSAPTSPSTPAPVTRNPSGGSPSSHHGRR